MPVIGVLFSECAWELPAAVTTLRERGEARVSELTKHVAAVPYDAESDGIGLPDEAPSIPAPSGRHRLDGALRALHYVGRPAAEAAWFTVHTGPPHCAGSRARRT
ncbi:hypothetical protein [Streptomyces sp. PA5.6]|uniref:hypothetical protein n=1 Tax=Streptomyces sp. PA5.6 TaxID=3035651 RepID=UPI00390493D3